ncbi:MAG: DUF5004 domain-containing protein [Tannerellaceae bacterium]|nr:DUF5004 domain-containing protein [Tannerellaceae bacterium]MCD8263339.1 DUF5004 domain-containing protein [Tannerellaceae bacterium]
MKISNYFLVCICIVYLLPFAGCNHTDDGSFVEPITVYEKIHGSWQATAVRQIDEIAKANSQSPSEMTLTNLFDFSTFTITLNVDGNNQPTTYEVGGSSPAHFPAQGYWELDYPFQNTDGSANIISLYSGADKSSKQGELQVTAMPGANRTMEIKFTRTTKDVPFVSYVYQLSDINE